MSWVKTPGHIMMWLLGLVGGECNGQIVSLPVTLLYHGQYYLLSCGYQCLYIFGIGV
jgi:hypothetical protein